MPPKIILDLCGGTGSWSRPWQLNGYDVRIITLPAYNVLTYEPPDNVWGALAAPPCTEFSVLNCIAENRKRDFDSGMEIVNACSMLYAAAWRAARAMGYKRLVTYILDSESGTSLKASGWKCVGQAGGLRWTGKRRPEVDLYPAQMKIRWEKETS